MENDEGPLPGDVFHLLRQDVRGDAEGLHGLLGELAPPVCPELRVEAVDAVQPQEGHGAGRNQGAQRPLNGKCPADIRFID